MRRIFLLFVLLTFFVNYSFAQRTVTGKITNDEGEGMPGVTVVAQGTDVATISDLSGLYSIVVPEGVTTLLFQYIGFENQEKPIADVVNVSMRSDTDIEEVIIAAVGISRDKKAIGYSIASVDNEKIENKAEPDLFRNLNGKVAGVNISGSSGAPGSSTRITIRGNSSFYGNNQPLIIVDGVPYSNVEYNTTNQSVGGGAVGSNFSTLDPNDIKTINILKGSAAGALYGSRAANGVILIETKSGNAKGTKKGLEISFTSGYSFEEISNLPEYQNTYGPGTNFVYQNFNGSWGARFDSMDSIPVWDFYKNAFPEDFPTDSIAYVAQPDNVSGLFQRGHLWDNSLTISGGNANSSVSLTGSSSSNNGYIPNSSFDRKAISLGGSTKLSNGVSLRTSFSYSSTDQGGAHFGNNQAISDYTSGSFARNLWLARNWIITDEYSENPYTGTPVQPNGDANWDNPFWLWRHSASSTKMDRTVANVSLSYEFLKYFNFSVTGGANVFAMDRNEYIDKGSKAYEGLGGIIEDKVSSTELEATSLLTFQKDLNEMFNLKVILGYNINQRSSDRQAYIGRVFVADGIFDLDNTETVQAFGGDYSNRRLQGAFYDISVGFNRYLFLNTGMRVDKSSTLPVEENTYLYPSVSLSFLLSDALGIQSNLLNMVKLRGGWARTGNDADPYSTINTYSVRGGSFPFLDQPTMYIPYITYDPLLTPEFTDEWEFGTNIILYNNRVDLDVTYYDRLSYNQLLSIEVPATTGYTVLYTNTGSLSNKGFEIGLNLNPVRSESGFNWNIYTTWTKNANIVETLPDSVERMVLHGAFGDPQPVFEEGEPYGILRGSVAARDDEGNLLIDPATGVLIPDLDFATIGNPNPDFILGLNNSLSWKGLGLSFQFIYKKGGDLYSSTLISMLGRGVTKDTEDREHTYILPGVYGDPDTGEPLLDANGNPIENVTQTDLNALVFGNSFAINGIAEFGVYDATVLRLSQVELSYSLPKKIIDKTPLGNISITFNGNNLWFYAPNVPRYSNFDPEVNTYGSNNTQGIDYTAAPSVRRFGASIKITF